MIMYRDRNSYPFLLASADSLSLDMLQHQKARLPEEGETRREGDNCCEKIMLPLDLGTD